MLLDVQHLIGIFYTTGCMEGRVCFLPWLSLWQTRHASTLGQISLATSWCECGGKKILVSKNTYIGRYETGAVDVCYVR